MIKLPKRYAAGGMWLKVEKKTLDHIGGQFDTNDMTISISPEMFKHDQDAIASFLHEAFEATALFANCRYPPKADLPYMFVFDHGQYEQIIRELSAGVQDLINCNRGKK